VFTVRFSLLFTQHRQEAFNSLSALKPWQNLSSGLSCYRRQSCVPSLSCDHFNEFGQRQKRFNSAFASRGI